MSAAPVIAIGLIATSYKLEGLFSKMSKPSQRAACSPSPLYSELICFFLLQKTEKERVRELGLGSVKRGL